MADSSVKFGGSPALGSAYTFNPVVADTVVGDLPPGTPVAASRDAPGEVVPANANAEGEAGSAPLVIGVTAAVGVVGGRVPVARAGEVVSLTTDQWDAVISGGIGGGLEQGAQYFSEVSSPQDSGQITTTVPTAPDTFQAQVGMVLSPTDLLVLPSMPVVNT